MVLNKGGGACIRGNMVSRLNTCLAKLILYGIYNFTYFDAINKLCVLSLYVLQYIFNSLERIWRLWWC